MAYNVSLMFSRVFVHDSMGGFFLIVNSFLFWGMGCRDHCGLMCLSNLSDENWSWLSCIIAGN